MKGAFRLVVSCYMALCVTATYGQPADTASYQGLLWKVTGNGLAQPSYLYGTMHVSQKLAFHLSDDFYDALQSCEQVALELNPETWLHEIVERELNLNPYGGLSYEDEDPDFYRRAFALERLKSEVIVEALSEDNNLLNSLLFRTSNGHNADYEEDTYLDLYIYQTGKKLGLEVLAIESFEQVKEFERLAQRPSDEDDERDTRKVLRDLTRQGISPQELLENAYRAGDLNMVDSLNRLLNPFSNWNRYMIVERNAIMASRMDSLMRLRPTFTGVGAAHLPGNQGVIHRLRDLGYTLESIPGKIGGKSRKYEKQIDARMVPVELERQTTEDGFISVALPGELYEMPGTSSFRTFIHPDMANGAYFWLKRMRTNAPMFGRTPQDAMARLDSLLYESIPGEILDQEHSTFAGYPSIEIRNKARSGSVQRYRIIATPLELILFKMSGTAVYMDTYSDQVFDSFALRLPESDWKATAPPERTFSCMMPDGAALYRIRMNEYPGVMLQSVDGEGNWYMAIRRVLNDTEYIEEDAFELEQLALTVTQWGCGDAGRTVFEPFHGLTSLSVGCKPPSGNPFTGRIIAHGPNYYALLTSNLGANGSKFLESFELTEPVSSRELEALQDTTEWFTCQSYPEFPEQWMASGMMGFLDVELEGDDLDFGFRFNNRLLRNGDTGEEVFVRAKQYGQFFSVKDLDALWDYEKQLLDGDEPWQVKETGRGSDPRGNWMTLALSRPGSSRYIHIAMINSGMRTYALKAVSDTVGFEMAYLSKIYSSFLPLNTEDSVDVFQSKTDLFFSYLDAGDEELIRESLDHIDALEFSQAELNRFGQWLTGPQGRRLASADHTAALARLGELRNAGTTALLEEIYGQNSHRPGARIACLEALAKQKTPASISAVNRLLKETPPVPVDGRSLAACYDQWKDSLLLSVGLLPALTRWNGIPEYRSLNLELAAACAEAGIDVPRRGRRMRNDWLEGANVELLRQQAHDEAMAQAEPIEQLDYRDRLKETQLLDYIQVLRPYAKRCKSVREFYTEALQTTNPLFRLETLARMTATGIVPDTVNWESWALDPRMRTATRRVLDTWLPETPWPDALRESAMRAVGELHATYIFEDVSKDVEMLREVTIATGDDRSGTYVFFKGTREDFRGEKEWHLFVVGPIQDESQPNVRRITRLDQPDRPEQAIDDAITDIRYAGRKRYRRKSSGYRFNGF